MRLATLQHWTLHGRFALSAGKTGGHASLTWAREGERHRLDITGPLGRGHLRLTQDDHGAELRDSEGNVERAEDAGELLFRATGHRLPLEDLPYWAIGAPRPGMDNRIELDGFGRARKLMQNDWSVEYLSYRNLSGLDLPDRLLLRHAAAGQEEIEVRLVIERWVLNR